MIISCPACKKKFEIESALIPTKGRDLQCGSCDHIWFYKIDKKIPTPLKLNEKPFIDDISTDTLINENKEKNKIEKPQLNNKKINKEGILSVSKFFSYIIVFLISFVALIIILDTFKTLLLDFFPNLEIILFNLFETLKDIFLFLRDLH